MSQHVAKIRAFNRSYTKIIGLLNEAMMDSTFVLAEARVIHEIGKRQPVTAAQIAHELAMDPGQLSRLLKRLERRDFVASQPSLKDARASALTLTAEGENACAALNTMSDKAVAELVSPLTDCQTLQLLAAMTTISELVGEPVKWLPEVKLRRHRLGDIGWLIHRQAVLYNAEFGWNQQFESLITRIYADFGEALEKPAKRLWIAELDNCIAGSVFVLPHREDPRVAQLRMLYVEPSARGKGIGGRLVDEAVSFARNHGYRSIMLWTQDCLLAAHKVYLEAGFVLGREHRHQAFGKHLTGQFWTLDLNANQ